MFFTKNGLLIDLLKLLKKVEKSLLKVKVSFWQFLTNRNSSTDFFFPLSTYVDSSFWTNLLWRSTTLWEEIYWIGVIWFQLLRNTVKKINLIQIGYLEFRTNLRSFRVIILVFRTISHYLNSKTEFGPGLEQFQQIRTILRFLDPI